MLLDRALLESCRSRRSVLRYLATLLAGCGTPPPASKVPTARAAVDRVHATQDCGLGIHANAKIDHFGKGGRVRGDLLAFAVWPAAPPDGRRQPLRRDARHAGERRREVLALRSTREALFLRPGQRLQHRAAHDGPDAGSRARLAPSRRGPRAQARSRQCLDRLG